MSQLYSVKAYYNTGLSVGNCLDNLSLLDSLGFTSRTFSSIAIKQNRGRIWIKINTQYDNIKDADYIKIGDVGYWVVGINMSNDNVAVVGLQEDPVTTVGIEHLEATSGWCTRRHVDVDTLYSNIIDEPFTPSQELVIDGCEQITNGNNDDGHFNVVLSNIDLLNTQNLAEKYMDADLDKVLVPQLPTISLDSQTDYVAHPLGFLTAFSNTISMTAAYNPNDNTVRTAIKKLRSLGIESAIGASYQLPNRWAQPSGSDLYSSITDRSALTRSQIQNIPGTYKNNKVYSGQFQKFVCYSICSGARAEFRPEDIEDGSVNHYINWHLWADTRYNGYPACQPAVYKGKENKSNFGIIKGAGWQQTPFMYTVGQSGYHLKVQDAYRDMQESVGASLWNAYKNTINFAGSMGAAEYGGAPGGAQGYGEASAYGGFGGVPNSIGDFAYNYMRAERQFAADVNRAMRPDPGLLFPQIPQLQDYVGNYFYELRYRLSDNDMVRFDNFLSAFGYAVDEIMDGGFFVGRTHFNYVQGRDITFKKLGAPQYLLNQFAKAVENGVRVWHTAPASSKLINNPIAS